MTEPRPLAESLEAFGHRIQTDPREFPPDPPEPTPAEARAAKWATLVPARFETAHLDRLDDPNAEPIRAWAYDGAGNLALTGDVGTGKTFAALAVARYRWETYGCRFAFWPTVELLEALRPGGNESVEHLAAVPLLVLDDLGADRATDWSIDRLYAIVNRRWLDNRPTVATTNLDPETLAQSVGGRIYSRLADGAAAFRLGGPDRRRTT